MAGVLDVGEQLAALADDVEAAPKQITRGAHARRVDVGLREHAAAQERRDLQGVDPVVLRLAAVDRLHIEGVAEDEGDLLVGAQVGDPVPGEDALDGDDEIVAVRGDRSQKLLRARAELLVDEHLAGLVEDAHVQAPGVQIDAAVVTVLLRVESHRFSPCADARVG